MFEEDDDNEQVDHIWRRQCLSKRENICKESEVEILFTTCNDQENVLYMGSTILRMHKWKKKLNRFKELCTKNRMLNKQQERRIDTMFYSGVEEWKKVLVIQR